MSIEKAIESLKSRVHYKCGDFIVNVNWFEATLYCRGELIACHTDYYTLVSAFPSKDSIIREATEKARELILGRSPSASSEVNDISEDNVKVLPKKQKTKAKKTVKSTSNKPVVKKTAAAKKTGKSTAKKTVKKATTKSVKSPASKKTVKK